MAIDSKRSIIQARYICDEILRKKKKSDKEVKSFVPLDLKLVDRYFPKELSNIINGYYSLDEGWIDGTSLDSDVLSYRGIWDESYGSAFIKNRWHIICRKYYRNPFSINGILCNLSHTHVVIDEDGLYLCLFTKYALDGSGNRQYVVVSYDIKNDKVVRIVNDETRRVSYVNGIEEN